MAKRVRDTLTGGTGDVSPQYMSGLISAQNGVVLQQQLGSPINRLQGASSGYTTVMEVLKVFTRMSGTDADSGAMTARDQWVAFATADISTTATLVRFSCWRWDAGQRGLFLADHHTLRFSFRHNILLP